VGREVDHLLEGGAVLPVEIRLGHQARGSKGDVVVRGHLGGAAAVLLFLAGITAAPMAKWSSDRGWRYKPPPLLVTLGLRKPPRRATTT
jgi:hypothetical protein